MDNLSGKEFVSIDINDEISSLGSNEDGINDLFFVNAAQGINILHLQIADRWGNIVFERNNLTPNDPGQAWDGRINGQLVPSGVPSFERAVTKASSAS